MTALMYASVKPVLKVFVMGRLTCLVVREHHFSIADAYMAL